MSCESMLTEAPTTRSKPTSVRLKLIAWIDPERRVLLALLGLALVLGVTYALITPPLMGPDEDAHYEYVESLWDSGGTKVTGRASYHQPAYYWLDAPAYALTRSQPKDVQLVVMRLVSVTFLLGEVVLAYLSAKLLAPSNRFVYLATPAIVALLPGRGWIAGMISDDNLASFSSSLVLYLFLRYLLHSRSRRAVAGLGASMLLAVLAKATAWPVVVVTAGALMAMAAVHLWQRSRPFGRGLMIVALTAVMAVLVAVVVAVVGGAGEPNASSSSEAPRQEASALLVGLEKLMPSRLSSLMQYDWSKFLHIPPWRPEPFIHQFKTFWIPLWSDDYSAPESVYQRALLLSVVAAAGLALSFVMTLLGARRRGIRARQAGAVAVLVVAALLVWSASLLQHLLMVAGTDSFNLLRVDWPPTHARYLFPALIPIAYLMAVGVGRFVPVALRTGGYAVFVAVLLYLDGEALWSIMSHAHWWTS